MLTDIIFKLIAIILSTGFFITAFVLKNKIGTSYHPSVIFAFVWGCFTLLPMIFLYSAPINPFAVLYILLCVIAFSISSLIDSNRITYLKFTKNKILRDKKLAHFDSRFLDLILFVSSLLGVVFCFWTMHINGWSLSDIFYDPLLTAGSFAAIRGNHGMEYGLIGSLGTIFTYLSASLGGLTYSVYKSKSSHFFIIIQAMAPALLAMVIQSSKLIFLISSCFFISGVFLYNIYKLKPLRINIKILFKLMKISLIIFPFILLSFISREKYGNLDDIFINLTVLKYVMTSYVFGQIYAFSDFFSFYIGMESATNYAQDCYRLGAYTFSSIAEIFGANVDFPPGLYLETGSYKDVFETNIFTIFRGVILDFGIIGSLVFFSALGFISNIVFKNILKLKSNIFADLAYMHIVVFLLMTYLFSVFMARYMYANISILVVIFLVNRIFKKSNFRIKN